MVNHNSTGLDSTFAALASPIRRAILATLARGETPIGVLAAPFAMTLPAVLKHLRLLEDAGLIARTKTGRTVHCRLTVDALRLAADWMATVLADRTGETALHAP